MSNTQKPIENGLPASLCCGALLGRFESFLSQAEVAKTMEDFEEHVPAEIVGIATILRGLHEYARDTADDEMADGFTGEEATQRSDNYYTAYAQLRDQWA